MNDWGSDWDSDEVEEILRQTEEHERRPWQEKWARKSNREKSEYLLGLMDLTGRITDGHVRILQAAQVYATLAVVDATEAQGKGLV